ncbi:MAG: hypothetical protein Kapaf2KO_15700 [Candidatus Kapaibacteriales bacterium]
MKNFLYLVIIIAFSSNAFSQAFNANEGFDFALNIAQSEIGNEAKLVAIATANGFSAGPVSIDYNMQEGTSQAWIYSFRNNSGEFHNVVVFRIFTFVDVTEQVGDLSSFEELLPNGALATEDWINSSETFALLSANSNYQGLQSKYPSLNVTYIALGNNEASSFISLEEPYWTFVYETDDQESGYVCYVAAETGDGEVTCVDFGSSVDPETFRENFLIESTDFGYFITPKKIISDSQFLIISTSGRLIKRGDFPTNGLSISYDEIAGSTFFLIIIQSGKQYTIPLAK